MHADPLGDALREALGDVIRGTHDALRARPVNVAQVSRLFAFANTHAIRVAVPGGVLKTGRDVVTLDLDALAAVRSLDEESQTLHVDGGALVQSVETHLRARGLTLGMRDELDPRLSVSAWLAKGAPGARAHADDPVDQLVCGLDVVLADGTPLSIRPAPRRAVGPDLVPAFVGGRACLGVIVGAHLVARRVTAQTTSAYRFQSRDAAEGTRAWVRGHGIRPASTTITEDGAQVFLTVRIEGARAVREACLAVVARVVAERGGQPCEAGDVPASPSPTASEPSDIVRALARALDPANVLGPSRSEGVTAP
jgi:FAD/FMN-containing dehydrogenase